MEAPDMDNNNENAFAKAKNEYTRLREIERKKIIAYLKDQTDNEGNLMFTKATGAKLDCRGGSGRKSYGKGKFNKLYDLSNWKFVEAMYKGQKFLISLQCFDFDTNSKNVHVLYDRIGIYLYDEKMLNINFENAFYDACVNYCLFRMVATEFDLPLSDDDLKELTRQIIDLCERRLKMLCLH